MEDEKQENVEETKSPVKNGAAETAKEYEDACRCKEAQGKTMTDFLKVMIEDLAFWRKKH